MTSLAPYIGLPYRWRGRSRSGIDCYGLVRMVLEEAYGATPPEYFYAGQAEAAALAAVEASAGARWARVPAPAPGDLLLFRVKGVPQHCGVYVGGGDFLHSLKNRDSCLERLAEWETRLAGVYRVKT